MVVDVEEVIVKLVDEIVLLRLKMRLFSVTPILPYRYWTEIHSDTAYT